MVINHYSYSESNSVSFTVSLQHTHTHFYNGLHRHPLGREEVSPSNCSLSALVSTEEYTGTALWSF